MKARDIRRNVKAIAAIAGLFLIAFATAAVILPQQRFKLPWDDRYTVQAGFESAKAVTPGQGQSVNVAGIQVGEISGVELRDGVAVVEMSIDPEKLPAVYADATMTLRPRTALEDQTVELVPGTRAGGSACRRRRPARGAHDSRGQPRSRCSARSTPTCRPT